MDRIIEYDIATAPSETELRDIVRDAIGEGWQPQGGVSVQVKGGFSVFHQAIVKFSSGTKPKSEKIKKCC